MKRSVQLAVGVAAAVASAVALTAAPAGASGSHGSDVYVSAAGNDRQPGTSLLPVRTLQRAQALVRERTSHATGDITVHLAPGVFDLSQPLQLDARDSGVNGHRVIWQGAGSSRTEISGGKQVTNWRPVPGRPGLYAAPEPKGMDNTRQLYVNGVREQRAQGTLPVTLKSTATGYTASAPTMAGWRNPSDIEFVYTAGEALWNIVRDGLGQWTEPRCPIGSMSGTTITMAQPCWDNSTKRVVFPNIAGRSVNMVGPYDLTNGRQPTYVENAFEVLDTPGEWYLDRSAHTVYYMPRPGENLRTADVEAPVLQQLVTTTNLTNVSFRGIQYSYATWLTPSSPEGFSEIQAGYTNTGPDGWAVQGLCQFVPNGTCPYASWTPEPGNVTVSHGTGLEFSDSAFTHLGAAGLRLADNTANTKVSGNIFTDISGNGIEIGGVDQPTTGSTHDVQVLDNHLYGLPREFHGGVAIINGYSQHDVISHNQIDNVAYSAISMGWGGWPDKIQVAATPNNSHDNVVSDNLIHDYMLSLDDGGGIYTQGITGSSLDTGEKVTGNVIYGQLGLGKGIYTDNGNTYENVVSNVVYGTPYANVGTAHVDYRDALGNNDPTLIQGNYWEQGDKDGNNKGVVTQGNHLLDTPAAAPTSIVDNAGLEAGYRGLLSRSVGGFGPPAQPTRVGTFAADGKIYVTWNPSYAFNNAPLDSYLITAGTKSVSIPAAQFSKQGYAEVSGLVNGTSTVVTVQAHNRFGASTPSLPSAPVTPGPLAGKVSDAPTGGKAVPSSSAASLHWTPPASMGDTPVIAYVITVSDGRTITVNGRDALVSQPTAKGMVRVVSGLTPSTAYTFTIAAVTADGPGVAETVKTTTLATS